jgi:[ribosomal protein S18]-alanine N-acetyltransferase
VSGRVRAARPDDLEALLALEAVFPTDRLDRRAFRRSLASPTIDVLVVESDGRVAGYGMIHRRSGSAAARLTSIAVAPDAAGRGLGRQLLAAAEAAARTRGCSRMRLEVRADNGPAQRLYGRAGYRRVETVVDYYEDGETALRFEKGLVPPSS